MAMAEVQALTYKTKGALRARVWIDLYSAVVQRRSLRQILFRRPGRAERARDTAAQSIPSDL